MRKFPHPMCWPQRNCRY